MHHDIQLSHHPLDIHRPNSVPNVAFASELHSVFLGAVWNGDRHDATPDEGTGNQNLEGGVIRKGIGMPCTGATVSIIKCEWMVSL